MCADLNLPLLGKIPLDPRIARSCDEGKSFLNEVPDSPAAKVYQRIVQSEYLQAFIQNTNLHRQKEVKSTNAYISLSIEVPHYF